MNISILLPGVGVYGGVRRFCNFADALIGRGNKVEIYTPEGKSPYWLPCEATFLKQNNFLDKTYDITISAYPSLDEYSLSIKAKAKIKVFYLCGIYDPASMANGKKPSNPWIAKLNEITKMFLLSKEFVKFSNATWLSDFTRKLFNIEIHPLIGGVDIRFFHPFKTKKIPLSVIFPGERRKFKASNYIYSSINSIRKRIPGVYFDSYKGRGLKQTKMSKFICSHTIFSDDQILAGWHNPVIEAMACGMPVACFDIPGVRDFAINKENCLLSSVGNGKGLSKSIISLLLMPELAKKLSENAFKTSLNFSWKKTAEIFEKIIC